MVRTPDCAVTETDLSYDFPAYFGAVLRGEKAALAKRKIRMRIEPAVRIADLKQYAKEIVWYGRRRGASVYHGDEVIVGTSERPGK